MMKNTKKTGEKRPRRNRKWGEQRREGYYKQQRINVKEGGREPKEERAICNTNLLEIEYCTFTGVYRDWWWMNKVRLVGCCFSFCLFVSFFGFLKFGMMPSHC